MKEIYAYCTSYCNKAHRVADGKPIQHECYVIPPLAIKREREGDIRGAIDLMQRSKMKHHMGVSK